jgi:hypothetical protein
MSPVLILPSDDECLILWRVPSGKERRAIPKRESIRLQTYVLSVHEGGNGVYFGDVSKNARYRLLGERRRRALRWTFMVSTSLVTFNLNHSASISSCSACYVVKLDIVIS